MGCRNRPSPDENSSAKMIDTKGVNYVSCFFPDLKKALTFIIDALRAVARRATPIVAPEEVLSLDPLRVCRRPRTGEAEAVVGGNGENEFSRKSLRTTSGSSGELCGHLKVGAGGDSLRGAGRRRALPFGFSPVVGDGQEATWLMGDTGLEGNATSRS
jgi:hypothetical protein